MNWAFLFITAEVSVENAVDSLKKRTISLF